MIYIYIQIASEGEHGSYHLGVRFREIAPIFENRLDKKI